MAMGRGGGGRDKGDCSTPLDGGNIAVVSSGEGGKVWRLLGKAGIMAVAVYYGMYAYTMAWPLSAHRWGRIHQ